MAEAARLDDPVAHSSAMLGLLGGLVAGAAIGAVIAAGTVATVATGGVALGLIIAGGAVGASALGGIFEVLGSLSVAPMWDTGILANGSGNVSINDKRAIRAHVDYTKDCSGSPPIYWPHHGQKLVAQGSDSVFINNMPAARVGDKLVCDAKIHKGSGNVFIGGGTFTTDEIESEIPAWMNYALAGLGLGGAIVLFGPVVALFGLAGGVGGGVLFNWLGGKLLGQGSDGQKLMMLGGSILGGGLAGWGSKSVAAALGDRIPGPWGDFVEGGVPAAVGAPKPVPAVADPRKFSDYIFNPDATHGKDVIFRNLGYSSEDAPKLANLYEEQAGEKVANGDYTLGKADQYGQRINVEIALPGQGAAAGQTSYLNSGWMLNPDGSIRLLTPFAGFTR